MSGSSELTSSWHLQYNIPLFYFPLIRGVCPNNWLVMFQPQTVTPPYLGSVVKCHVSYSTLLNPLCPSRPSAWFPYGGGCPYPPLGTLPFTSGVHSHSIILPPGRHLSLSQNPETHISLPHLLTPLCPCLLLSRHACQISNASPLPPPKSTLT